ncbi:MAG: amidohydrolase [Gemmataceae bacterium]|jgi:predicted amidohydrolase YtcJ|nr:amidohydrolase [Gemmataceae bacterium]
MRRSILVVVVCCWARATPLTAVEKPAELIIHNAKIITVDSDFSIKQAIAIREGKILAIGDKEGVLSFADRSTKIIDAQGQTILPGLIDSHVHPVGAALSEAVSPLPVLNSLEAVQDFIRKKVETTPEGKWIVIRYAFPTRLTDARFPTKAELDAVAPKHPVLYHAGPAGVVNSLALKISNITKDTPNPPQGTIVKDEKTGEPTGMLRNAYGVLKGVPSESDSLTRDEKKDALKKLLAKYNAEGLTSVADRNASRSDLDLYLALEKANELTVRINVARGFSPAGTAEEIAKRFDSLIGDDKRGGPTGAGTDWVKIGPIKLFLDGGMLNGTAYMREPWPQGPAYQVTQNDYQGLLFIQPKQLELVVTEAAKRRWQVTAHCAGEKGMDILLDAYETANKTAPIKELRYCITHANFPSEANLKRCEKYGVCADVQPVWLYKDGPALLKNLGEKRMRWFQPYQSWLKYTTIGGGSDHMLRYDPFLSTNPWSPWLGIATAVTRRMERDGVHQPSECLTREQAIRLYTINNAYLHHEEKIKGSLEVGKLADLILIDRDILTCPSSEIAKIRVKLTIVGGKIVYQSK